MREHPGARSFFLLRCHLVLNISSFSASIAQNIRELYNTLQHYTNFIYKMYRIKMYRINIYPNQTYRHPNISAIKTYWHHKVSGTRRIGVQTYRHPKVSPPIIHNKETLESAKHKKSIIFWTEKDTVSGRKSLNICTITRPTAFNFDTFP